jgi:hypothetical protein
MGDGGRMAMEGTFHCLVFYSGGVHLSLVRTYTWREALLRGGRFKKGK